MELGADFKVLEILFFLRMEETLHHSHISPPITPPKKIDFGDMKENGKIPIRRIESKKVEKRHGQNSPKARGQHGGAGDDDASQRDCFEYYDAGRERWIPYSPSEDKILKNAWLKGSPTTRFDSFGKQWEVNFELLKVKRVDVSVQDASLPENVRSIRHPVKFGPFRRTSKVHNFEDVFDDILRDHKKKKAAADAKADA